MWCPGRRRALRSWRSWEGPSSLAEGAGPPALPSAQRDRDWVQASGFNHKGRHARCPRPAALRSAVHRKVLSRDAPPTPPSGHGSPSRHVPSVSAPGHQPGCVGLGGGGGCADVTAVTWRQCPPAPSHSMRSKPTLLEGNFANSKDWGPQTLILPPAFLSPTPARPHPQPLCPLELPLDQPRPWWGDHSPASPSAPPSQALPHLQP